MANEEYVRGSLKRCEGCSQLYKPNPANQIVYCETCYRKKVKKSTKQK